MFNKLSREETILLSGRSSVPSRLSMVGTDKYAVISVVGVEAKIRLLRVWIW